MGHMSAFQVTEDNEEEVLESHADPTLVRTGK